VARARSSEATDVSDATLVDAVRRGELSAFARLYSRHVGAVRTVVRDHVRDSEQAADTVQETFARALESLPRLVDPERFRPWLLSIARHTAVDARRGRSRPPELLEEAEQVPSGDPTPDELAEIAELATLVRLAIGGLSSRDATALGMVALGFGVEDVAQALGIGHGAAKVVLHRGRRRLRAAILLEILTRRQLPGCADLAEIEETRLVAIARHLETCEACAEAALRQ
jgi:RNA polymerase sigma factor (sigma-70 family)